MLRGSLASTWCRAKASAHSCNRPVVPSSTTSGKLTLQPVTVRRSGDRCAILDHVRKQYFFKPNGTAFDAWDVDRLVALSADLPVEEVPLSSITEIDSAYWFGADGSPVSVRVLVQHMELVSAADLEYPVILGCEGQLMDGMHRVAKALLQGRSTVRAVRLTQQPEPDYVNVRPDELPYD